MDSEVADVLERAAAHAQAVTTRAQQLQTEAGNLPSWELAPALIQPDPGPQPGPPIRPADPPRQRAEAYRSK